MRRLTIAVVILIVGGVIAAWVVRPQNVCRVPAVCTVQDKSVTLERVQRLNNVDVRIVLLAHSGRTRNDIMCKVGQSRIPGAVDIEQRWVRWRSGGAVEFWLTFKPAKNQKYFSLNQRLSYMPKPRRVTLRYKGIDPASLPVKMNSGSEDAALLNIYANREIISNRNQRPGGWRWVCLHKTQGVSAKGRLYYALELDVPTSKGSHVVWECKLKDDTGRVYGDPDYYYDAKEYGHYMSGKLAGVSDPNVSEKMVGFVNPMKADEMRNKRIEPIRRNVEKQKSRETILFAFPEMKRLPRSLDLELSGDLYVDDVETVSFSFERVPLP